MQLRLHRLSRLVALVWLSPGLCSSGLWGCAGTLADPEDFQSLAGDGGLEAGPQVGPGTASEAGAEGGTGCPDVPTTIFQQTCGASGCHGPPSPQEGLDLASPGVASRLINVPSAEMPALDLINSMAPEKSAVLTKLSAPPPFGSQMPFGEPPLSAQQIGCVSAWIDSVIADAGPAGTPDSGALDSGVVSTDAAVLDANLSATDSSVVDAGQVSADSGVVDARQLATDGGGVDAHESIDSSEAMPDAGLVDSSKGADTGSAVPTFTEVYTAIFAAHDCTTHHSGAATGGLDMTTQAKAYADLVGVRGCSGDRVVAGSAATSLLYLKVSDAKPPCGSQMPPKGPYLSTAEQMTIENWINGGAKND